MTVAVAAALMLDAAFRADSACSCYCVLAGRCRRTCYRCRLAAIGCSGDTARRLAFHAGGGRSDTYCRCARWLYNYAVALVSGEPSVTWFLLPAIYRSCIHFADMTCRHLLFCCSLQLLAFAAHCAVPMDDIFLLNTVLLAVLPCSPVCSY
jgi:hypothetical protein